MSSSLCPPARACVGIRVVAEINSTAAAIAAITIKDIVLLFFFLFLLISIICKIEYAGFSL
ncbi:MAG: hypothetical protein WA421_15095 [Nitrososphaeraceae archaeon]